MKTKERLRTVRFPKDEGTLIDEYLKHNKIFESFSALARVATLTFISQEAMVKLMPVSLEKTTRPAFLWDYDLTENQVRETLETRGLSSQKKWLIERILTQARFDETLKYMNIKQVKDALPHLKLPNKIRERWEYALTRWKT